MRFALAFLAAILAVVGESQLLNTTGVAPGLGSLGWRRSTGSSTQVTAYGNATVFVAFSNDSIAAFNATSGATMWRYDAWVDYGYVQWLGLYGNVLAFQTRDYMAGLSTADGSVAWNATLPGAQRFHTAQTPVGVDNDCFLAFADDSDTTGSATAHLIHFDATTGMNMSMWNSSAAYTASNNFEWVLQPSAAMVNGSLLIAAGFQGYSNYRIAVINVSNATGVTVINQYDDVSSTFTPPKIMNSSVYVGGRLQSSGYTGAVAGYDIATGMRNFFASAPSSGSFSVATFSTMNGMPVALARTSSSSNDVYSLNGTGLIAQLSTTGSSAYLVAWDMNMWYLGDSRQNYYAVKYGASNWGWMVSSIGSNYGSPDAGLANNGKVWVSQRVYINGSTWSTQCMFQLNAMTGAYEAIVATPSYANVIYANPITGNAMSAVAISNYNVWMAVPAGPGITLSFTSTVRTPLGFYNGAVFFATSDYAYAYGVNNGTQLWRTAWPASTTYPSSSQTLGFNDNTVFIMSADGDTIVNYDAMTGAVQTAGSVNPTPSACSASVDFNTMVADPWSEWVYFAAGSISDCVIRVKRGGTVEAIKADDSVYKAPIFREDYVVFGDDLGKLYVQRKSAITSTSATDRYVSSLTDGTPASLGPVLVYWESDVYAQGSIDLRVYSTVGPRLQFIYGGSMPGPSASTMPWIFGGKLYGVTTNGTMVRFELTAALTKLDVISTTVVNQNYPLNNPIIAPFGTFVFSNVNGIFGVSYTGQNLWNITSDVDGSLGICSNVAYRLGLAYVMCGSYLRVVDVLKGRIYEQSGSSVNSDSLDSVVVDTSNENSLSVVYSYGRTVSISNMSTRLYSAADLPAAIDNNPSILDLLKKNKIWIVGAAAGALVLIIIIAVAVKLTGGSKKNENDYVSMNSSPAAGGV